MNEPVTVWFVRVWDIGVNRISLTAVEAEKLSKVSVHSSLRQGLHEHKTV